MTSRGTSRTRARRPASARWDVLASYRTHVLRLLRRQAAAVDAEDVTRGALLRAYLQPDLDPSQAGPCLARIATKLAIDQRRRIRKKILVTPAIVREP